MFQGLEHTAIASPDPKGLAEWYVQKLDFRINYTYGGNYFVRASNSTLLEIIPSEGDRAPQQMKDPGIRHLAIAVDNFDSAMQELRKRGITVPEPTSVGSGAPHTSISDPNGVRLEMLEFAPGSMQRSAIEAYK